MSADIIQFPLTFNEILVARAVAEVIEIIENPTESYLAILRDLEESS